MPLIFVSGERTESFDRVAGLLLGADDFLTKPVAADELLARLRCLLRRGQAGLRDVDADPSRAGGASAACERPGSGRDRREACDQPEDGREPHRASPLQAGAHSSAEAVALAYRLGVVSVRQLRLNHGFVRAAR